MYTLHCAPGPGDSCRTDTIQYKPISLEWGCINLPPVAFAADHSSCLLGRPLGASLSALSFNRHSSKANGAGCLGLFEISAVTFFHFGEQAGWVGGTGDGDVGREGEEDVTKGYLSFINHNFFHPWSCTEKTLLAV